MSAFVALLRGINVGGKNVLPMKEFRALLTTLGCEDVATYIQSGNAVFTYTGNAAKLPASIASAIESAFGFRPSLMVLAKNEFNAIATANPFSEEVSRQAGPRSEQKYLHIWFVQGSTANANTARLEEIAAAGERFLLTDSAFYLHAPNGIGRSKLASEVEKCLGVPATARNCRTVSKIGEMLGLH